MISLKVKLVIFSISKALGFVNTKNPVYYLKIALT